MVSTLFSARARACAVVGLGAMFLLGGAACGTSRDTLYTQMDAPNGGHMAEGSGRLIDDHGDVHGSQHLESAVDVREKVGDTSGDGDEAAGSKIREH